MLKEQIEDLVERVQDYAKELASIFAEYYEQEYDWLTSDECVIDSIIANEWDIEDWVFERKRKTPSHHTCLAA